MQCELPGSGTAPAFSLRLIPTARPPQRPPGRHGGPKGDQNTPARRARRLQVRPAAPGGAGAPTVAPGCRTAELATVEQRGNTAHSSLSRTHPAPTLPAQENIGAGVLQERKRKMSPPAAAPAAKRAAPATAPSGVAAPPEDAVWEQIAEETGWSVTDCLAHKVTFAKRADAKAKVEPLVAHVKRLRAAGWYLHDQKERWVAPPRKSRGRGRRAVCSVCRSGDWP